MKKILTICGLVITTLPVFAQWFTNGNNDIQANLGSSKVLVGVLPGTLPGRINIAAPSSMPHISLFGGPLVSASNLLNRFNLNIGTTASLGMITNDNSGACGLGMLNGPNLASPVIWMYNSGSGNNAFTVSRVNYDPVGISNLENNFVTLFQVRENGNVGIGTTNPTQKLTVKGTVYSTEVKVDINAGTGPDYVFEPTYTLPSLDSVQQYIKQNKHLPEILSAKEMEANGVNLGEMNMLLLKKVEELTLYMIGQNKKMQLQQSEIENQKKEMGSLKRQIDSLKSKK